MLALRLALQQPLQIYLDGHTSYGDGSAMPADAYANSPDVVHLDRLAITEHLR